MATAESMIGERALVIGAGVAGLTAAAALAHHFQQVVILESDVLPDAAAPRPGVPQGRHVHGLLGGGIEALSALLPNFGEALLAAGAIPIRVGLDSRLEQPGFDPFPQRDLGLQGYSMTRPLLEHVVRKLVLRDSRVEIRAEVRVREILGTPGHDAASGVRVQIKSGGEETLQAPLVIDASGRGALTLDFLTRAGFELPEESNIPVNIRYTCGIFRLAADAGRDWKILLTRPNPKESGRRAIMFPIEGEGRWLLGLGGVDGDSAPPDMPGFIEYARTLRTPTVYNALVGAELEGELARFALPKSVRRHFEKLARFPCGLLPLGDAVCRINPSFGQGMSVAAREALLLDATLESLTHQDDPLRELAGAFFKPLGLLLHDPWATARQDFVYPHLSDSRPDDFAETMKFQAAIGRLAAADPAVHRVMWEVTNLIRPSSAYAEPMLATRLAAEVARV